jgi:hypothetical protein
MKTNISCMKIYRSVSFCAHLENNWLFLSEREMSVTNAVCEKGSKSLAVLRESISKVSIFTRNRTCSVCRVEFGYNFTKGLFCVVINECRYKRGL